MWVIWASIIGGVPILQFVIGGGLPLGSNPPSAEIPPLAIVGVVMVIISTGVRWLALPRYSEMRQQLIMMIIGLSLSESAFFLSLSFLPRDQPETRLAIFVLSLLGMVQFMPLYARAEPRGSFR
jgi:hypothetical protein